MMRDTLLRYYEGELRFIRKMAGEFAEKYPEVAGRLLLEPTKCEDPHVERLIESFAMLSARVHLRLDEDFPEITDALLGILYPHYLAPIPSMTIVQLGLDPEQGAPAEGVFVDRHSVLESRPVDGVRCKFRTAYSARLWPLEVVSAEIVAPSALRTPVPAEARSVLRLKLRTLNGSPAAELAVDRLAFFLNAESGSIHKLYEFFFRDALGLMLRRGTDGPPVVLGSDQIRPMGFERDEGLLEYPLESFLGYRLIQEYFAFPEKFLFAELSGFERLPEAESPEIDVAVLLRKSLADVDVHVRPENFVLGCTPAVNLFPHQADPIRLDQRTVEHRVTPDVRFPYSYEVHSVREVTSIRPGTAYVREFHPFYAVRHGMTEAGDTAFWHCTRRPSMRRNDPGCDFYLTLVDSRFNPATPDTDVLHVKALCTNRDLPARLAFGDPGGDFDLPGRPEVQRIRCLRKPQAPLRAPAGVETRWRLVSHLALNYLSIAEGAHERNGGGADTTPALAALREILRLYDFVDSAVTRQRIEGLVGLRSRRVLRRVGRGSEAGFAKGIEVELEFDEQKYTGSGVFLFASVLEHFLGLYTSLNSFSQTVARLRQRDEVLERWPPRAGEIRLL